MAILSQSSSNNWMLSLKVVLISTCVLFAGVILKLFVPVLADFAFSGIPLIWSFVVSWLRPPYLYVVINCIIITIVASSKLQNKVGGGVESPPETVVLPVPIKVTADYEAVYDGVDVKNIDSVEVTPEFAYDYDAVVVKGSDLDSFERVEDEIPELENKTTTLALNAAEEMSGQDDLAVSKSLWATRQLNSTEYSLSPYEKPPVSVRIGHRKSVKSTPEGGRALGVSKPKRHDTLESTWKTITEGRPIPLARHLRKSDTWETHGGCVGHQPEPDHWMTKSETFQDRTAAATTTTTATATTATSYTNRPPVKLKREPSGSEKLKRESSPSQDELNRRVEAFIKKFNEQMRLQKQESLNKYMEMINRGAN